MAVGHRGKSSESDRCSGALSSSTIMVIITAITASENATSRSALTIGSRMTRFLLDRDGRRHRSRAGREELTDHEGERQNGHGLIPRWRPWQRCAYRV